MYKKPKTIPVMDLAGLLAVDYKQYKKMMIRSGRAVKSSRSSIAAREADEIFFEFRGQNIDWEDYLKRSLREDQTSIQLLDLTHLHELANTIMDREAPYFRTRKNAFIGCASRGGFLRGRQKELFSFTPRGKQNLLIGDRGTGKSTITNLAANLKATPKSTQEFMLSNVLTLDDETDDDGIYATVENLNKTLQEYSIEEYAFVHKRHGEYFAFLLQVDSGWAVYKLIRGNWTGISPEEYPRLRTFVLKQGDVFRIADVRDDLVFTKIFDSLYQKLGKSRERIKRELRATKIKGEKVQIKASGILASNVERWANQLRSRLGEIRSLLIREDHRSKYALRDFFVLIHEFEALADYPNYSNGKEIFQSEAIFRQAVFFSMKQELRDFRRSYFHMSDGRYSSTSPELIPLSENQLLKASSLLLEIIDRVRDSISRIEKVAKALSNAPSPTNATRQLVNAMAQFYDLRRLQNDEIRARATKVSTQVTTEIPIAFDVRERSDLEFWSKATQKSLQSSIEVLSKYLYTPLETPTEEIVEAAQTYEELIEACIRFYSELGSSVLPIDYTEISDPVEAFLKQGNQIVPFDRLSFGQKSGLLLALFTSLNDSELIILDQPEDNLDTSGVVSILLPLLQKISKRCDVLIATHNANLVMGLKRANIQGTQSRGNYSTIGFDGSMSERKVVQSTLDILEGGIEPFQTKMELYRDFLQRLDGLISDIDIAGIERLFRNITLQELTHYLNPMITDAELIEQQILEFAKHETKPQDRNILLSKIEKAAELVTTHSASHDNDFEVHIRSLLTTLYRHVEKIDAAIRDVRMLDTVPSAEIFDLGAVAQDCWYRLASPLKKDGRTIDFIAPNELAGLDVYCDPDHVKLVLTNVFENCLNATGSLAQKALLEDTSYHEVIQMRILPDRNRLLRFEIFDNGCGMHDEVRKNLYKKRISSGVGPYRGLGGMIISKLLSINGGEIRVLSSQAKSGTRQLITIPRQKKNE